MSSEMSPERPKVEKGEIVRAINSVLDQRQGEVSVLDLQAALRARSGWENLQDTEIREVVDFMQRQVMSVGKRNKDGEEWIVRQIG